LDLLKTIEYFGIFCGYLFFLYFSDNYGRKFSLIMTWGCTCFGVALLVLAQNMEMAVIGLFFAGAGCETAIIINMSVLGEIVDYYQRQFYSVALEVSFGIGGCFIAIMYYIIGEWRFFNIIFVALPSAVIMAFFIFYFEETPKFLLKKPRK
jgi:MFS family permease